jgi:FkbM family methyltransferase
MMDFRKMIAKHNLNITGILHCGSNVCEERFLYDELGVPVYWIEANPEMYEQARVNIQPYSKQKVYLACLGEEDGREVTFNISNNAGQSSSYLQLGVHSEIHPTVSYINSFKTKTIRLDSMFSPCDLAEVNFGNFDVQGSELLCLIGMGDLLNQIDYLWIETNLKETYIGCALRDDIDAFLSDFIRVDDGEFVCGVWSDSLYVRRSLLNH